MLFDATIAPAQIEIEALEEQVQFSMGLALVLPVTPQQAMALPAGVLRFGLTKEDAIRYGQELIDKANTLPDPKPESDLLVATNMSEVEAAAKRVENLTKGKK